MENTGRKWDFCRCMAVLSQEAALLQKLLTVQDSVRQAVVDREWADFDWKTAEIRQLSLEFGELDAERAALFSALAPASGETPPFYTLILKLPPEERRELSTLYRALKMEAVKIRVLNESFLNYLNEAKITAAAYLEAVFPARGGKLYTRGGGQADRDLKSMIFNRHI